MNPNLKADTLSQRLAGWDDAHLQRPWGSSSGFRSQTCRLEHELFCALRTQSQTVLESPGAANDTYIRLDEENGA